MKPYSEPGVLQLDYSGARSVNSRRRSADRFAFLAESSGGSTSFSSKKYGRLNAEIFGQSGTSTRATSKSSQMEVATSKAIKFAKQDRDPSRNQNNGIA